MVGGGGGGGAQAGSPASSPSSQAKRSTVCAMQNPQYLAEAPCGRRWLPVPSLSAPRVYPIPGGLAQGWNCVAVRWPCRPGPCPITAARGRGPVPPGPELPPAGGSLAEVATAPSGRPAIGIGVGGAGGWEIEPHLAPFRPRTAQTPHRTTTPSVRTAPWQ